MKACSPWADSNSFLCPKEILLIVKKTDIEDIFREFFLFYHENVCGVYSLELLIQTILMSTLNILLFYKSKRHL